MNRYTITNLRTTLVFLVEAASQPERTAEYGPAAGTKLQSQCTVWELANGESAGVDENNQPLWSFPDSMQVSWVNIDAEIAAREALAAARAAAITLLEGYDPETATTEQRQDWEAAVTLLILNPVSA
jgi:hypothetical protein